jgi:hypothetical protein
MMARAKRTDLRVGRCPDCRARLTKPESVCQCWEGSGVDHGHIDLTSGCFYSTETIDLSLESWTLTCEACGAVLEEVL